MKEHIGTERTVHGRPWGRLHGGYFSDPTIAQALVEAVRLALTKTQPDLIIDIGGGTGFVASLLRAQNIITPDISLINLDCSDAQIALSNETGISSVCASAGDFRRQDIAPIGRRILFMARSVFHYFGKDGLLPLLHHLRSQAEEGEFFVHQSACFDSKREAACLNALYKYMNTCKWYPVASTLQRHMGNAGWQTISILPAPSLHLTSCDLSKRYALDTNAVMHIQKAMASEFGDMKDIFRVTPDGFSADLHYRIFICKASAYHGYSGK